MSFASPPATYPLNFRKYRWHLHVGGETRERKKKKNQRERERERDSDRQTDIQTDRQTDIQTDRHRHWEEACTVSRAGVTCRFETVLKAQLKLYTYRQVRTTYSICYGSVPYHPTLSATGVDLVGRYHPILSATDLVLVALYAIHKKIYPFFPRSICFPRGHVDLSALQYPSTCLAQAVLIFVLFFPYFFLSFFSPGLNSMFRRPGRWAERSSWRGVRGALV
eukprot:3285464-Rhodomonas_salina.1